MATDLTIGLVNQPGNLAAACEALGHAGVNIEAACGLVVDGRAELHILVADAELASRTLIDAGFDLLARRQVLALPIENRPGAAATLLRRLAEGGVNIDLVYTTLDGRLILASDDLASLRAAIG
jgi:hypothetical protein